MHGTTGTTATETHTEPGSTAIPEASAKRNIDDTPRATTRALGGGLIDRAIRAYQTTGRKQRLFTAFGYLADSWDRSRTIIAKAECHDAGTNLRFIVTSLPIHGIEDAERIYDDYVQRGENEHRMDELKNGSPSRVAVATCTPTASAVIASAPTSVDCSCTSPPSTLSTACAMMIASPTT